MEVLKILKKIEWLVYAIPFLISCIVMVLLFNGTEERQNFAEIIASVLCIIGIAISHKIYNKIYNYFEMWAIGYYSELSRRERTQNNLIKLIKIISDKNIDLSEDECNYIDKIKQEYSEIYGENIWN